MPKKTTSKKTKPPSVGDRAQKAIAKKGVVTAKNGRRKPPKGKGATLSDADLLLRLRIVEQALIDGKRGGQVLEELNAALSLNVPYSTCADYMRRVRDKWELEDSMLRPIWRERQMRKVHEIAKEIEKDRAWGHWISAQRLIADLEGNLAPVKVDVTHRDQFEDWELDELKRYVKSEGKEIPERFAKESQIGGSEGAVWSTPPTVH